MKRIVRLTERDLSRIVRRVIMEKEMSGSVPGCTDTITGKGHNLGCVTNRKPYYDMMKSGGTPNVVLTYKLDGPWFDNHSYTTMYDSATFGMGMDKKTLAQLLLAVRKGSYGVNPSKPNMTFILEPEYRKAASDEYGINAQLEKVIQGSGSPK